MIYDVVVIGGGPAAFSAAIYTKRKMLKTLVLSKNVGGQAAWAVEVENYPGISKINGTDLIFNMQEKAKEIGSEIILNCEVQMLSKKNKIFSLSTSRGNFEAKSVIIASGREPRKLDIPGEKGFLGRGVAYCATCDAPLFKNKIVVVVGGGNAALQSARDLSAYAKKIYVLERGYEFIGDARTLKDLKKNKKIFFQTNTEVKEIQGEKYVESIKIISNNQAKTIDASGIFIEIGSAPACSFAPPEMKKNDSGEIIINHKDKSTNIPGIFAAGDVTDILYKQIIIAAGEGASAAISVNEYLSAIK